MIEEEMKVGPKGQVVIPRALRRALKIHPGARVIFRLEDGRVVLLRPETDAVALLERRVRGDRLSRGFRHTCTRKGLRGGWGEMLYLNANVFVYAALNQGDVGDRARSLLREVQQGNLSAASSALTFDELVWAVKRYRSLEDTTTAGEAFLNMSSLKLVDVN